MNDVLRMPEDRRDDAVGFDRPIGELALEGLSFGFGADRPPVIDDVRFTIKPGALHGIVGRNGSGKTTLLKLMQGLYAPDHGRVLLDGADIAQFGRRTLAGWIGYVPQECFLFAASVRENIAIRDPGADDDAVVAAARLAGVHDTVIDLPDGYATRIGEAGAELSAGLRQRIAIARALLGDPPVLLLDEPTSNLDREAEEQISKALGELARTRNVVVVTHSPILLSACDNIIALDRGRVAFAGPAREVAPKTEEGQARLRAVDPPR